MSKHESDREDLIRDATALVRRAELVCDEFPEPTVAGFRRDGSLSVYFGPDPVYHFDSAGRLRRAYVGGLLYRTQGDTLASMDRRRDPAETVLERRDLDRHELGRFLRDTRNAMQQLRDHLAGNSVTISRCEPIGDDLRDDLFDRIDGMLADQMRLAPPIPGRR